jgi:hypothetical protein
MLNPFVFSKRGQCAAIVATRFHLSHGVLTNTKNLSTLVLIMRRITYVFRD